MVFYQTKLNKEKITQKRFEKYVKKYTRVVPIKMLTATKVYSYLYSY